MATYYFNIIDWNYHVQNENGITQGIGRTLKQAVENAEFLGVDCSELENIGDY